MKRAIYTLGLGALVCVACSKDKPSEVTTTGAQPASSATTATTTTPSATTSAAATPANPSKPVLTLKDGIVTPESVLYDADADEYVISNINGDPLTADGNGFISRFSPDGKVVKLKWIDKLNAPKGLAISGDNLYVADIDRVRMFDKKTGAAKGEVAIPGGTFANDLATALDGRVLVSETGLKKGAGKDFEPTNNDAVYAIDKDKKLTTIAKTPDLGRPNGLLPVANDKIWVVTFGSGELYALDAKGKKSDAHKLPKGSLDGIVALPNGDVLVSSWEGSGVYRGKPGGDFKMVIEDVKAPADIGYDTKRSRVLVPMFNDNEVRAYEIK